MLALQLTLDHVSLRRVERLMDKDADKRVPMRPL
jgi:hypothetical protein